jgi:hypothetical protein
MPWRSLRYGHLIDDKGGPDGRDIQTGLADRVFQTRHTGRFLVFPMPAVAFNQQNPDFPLTTTP